MISPLNLLCASLLLAAFSHPFGPRLTAQVPDTTPALILSQHGLPGITMCAPLRSVRRSFPMAKDTVIESEGASWPALIIRVRGGTIEVESSWSDTSHSWRVSTTTPAIRTPSGVRVGMLVARVEASQQVTGREEEGFLVLRLEHDSVAALVDPATQRAYASFVDTLNGPPFEFPKRATIAALVAGGSCGQRH